MLKLTRHLFAWAPSAEAMDFYERGALQPHPRRRRIPKTGMVLYYCPLKPGAFKTFSTPTDSFWCCVGTGMENHAKYHDSIYFHDEASLYVNLFIPSELTWKAKQAKIRQLTSFPETDTTSLTLSVGSPVRFAVRLASSRLGPIGDDRSRERPAGGLVVELLAPMLPSIGNGNRATRSR